MILKHHAKLLSDPVERIIFCCARLKFSKMTVPDDGFSIEDSIYKSVDFPAPEGPVTKINSPGSISKLIF